MRRLRVFIACLLALVLPLQGFASASMPACTHAPAHEVAHPPGPGAHLDRGEAAAAGPGEAVAQPAAQGQQAQRAGPDCAGCTLACCHAVAPAVIALELAAPPVATERSEPESFADRIEPVPRKPPRA